MRAVVQRVSSASVTIDGTVTAQISRGLLVLLGIQNADTPEDLSWLAQKIASLRIFEDSAGKMNLSLLDPVGGALRPDTAPVLSAASRSPASHPELETRNPEPTHPAAFVLVVSQFTLLASTRKGTRPSFNDAARPTEAIPLYEAFVRRLEQLLARPVATGTFAATMQVSLVNDGPVTLILDSRLRE
jgi:D-tyrosyl-tRNA(Tyr) deacylase